MAAVLATLLSAGSVIASCGEPIPIEEALASADSVFTGTVVRLADSDRTATIEVEEVWRGPDLAAQVVVRGGQDGLGFTSGDRTWEGGGSYLVFASIVDGQLTDSACSGTQRWSAELARLRPSDARPPSDAADTGAASIPVAWLIVIGVVGAVVVVSFLAFRRAR